MPRMRRRLRGDWQEPSSGPDVSLHPSRESIGPVSGETDGKEVK
jgi:hypothetical protein